MYMEDFTVLVVVSETAGLFDDVISAYVFGLPDSERCAGAVQHSEDKATIILINLDGNETLLWQKLAQENGQNEGVQAKCASAGY